jgi:perosamine synthetase
MPDRIPLSVPTLAGNEARYLQQCIDDGWVASGGPFVRRFESAFAEVVGRRAVSVVNGTMALHLAMVELGIGPGDEVVVPTLTFVATVNPVRHVGATPVFADVEPETYTIDPASVDRQLTDRTRAVVPVHLYGHPAAMMALRQVCADARIAIVEDATEALGSLYEGRPCGTLGDTGAFSFNGNKVITSGGGGMLVANADERLEHLRHLTLHARVPGTTEYLHDGVGFNAAMPNISAAVGLAQIERLNELLEARRAIASRYANALGDVDDLRFCSEASWAKSNFWLMSVLVDERVRGRTREGLAADLDAAGVDTRPFFHPVGDLAMYRPFLREETPVARLLHRRGLSLPSSPSLTPADQDRVIAALRG